jgi:hypothetical protein
MKLESHAEVVPPFCQLFSGSVFEGQYSDEAVRNVANHVITM